jgi:hypoxanthine phosphoribosyltransferase
MKNLIQHVSWEEVDDMVNYLARTIEVSGKQYAYIAGVERGGLVPAVMLSHRLDIPMCAIAPDEKVEDKTNVLIVDEIYDTGETIRKLKLNNPHADFAVLFHNEGLPAINFYAVKKDLVQWIVFPWEKK